MPTDCICRSSENGSWSNGHSCVLGDHRHGHYQKQPCGWGEADIQGQPICCCIAQEFPPATAWQVGRLLDASYIATSERAGRQAGWDADCAIVRHICLGPLKRASGDGQRPGCSCRRRFFGLAGWPALLAEILVPVLFFLVGDSNTWATRSTSLACHPALPAQLLYILR